MQVVAGRELNWLEWLLECCIWIHRDFHDFKWSQRVIRLYLLSCATDCLTQSQEPRWVVHHWTPWHLHQYSREGNYERTLDRKITPNILPKFVPAGQRRSQTQKTSRRTSRKHERDANWKTQIRRMPPGWTWGWRIPIQDERWQENEA